MNEQLNRYELIDPVQDDWYSRYCNYEKQIDSFFVANGNKYPFIIYSKNETWNETYSTVDDMVISNDAERDYRLLTYMNMSWASSTTTVDIAYEDQGVLNYAYDIYGEFCYKKDQIPFRKFYDAYASMHNSLLSLIR